MLFLTLRAMTEIVLVTSIAAGASAPSRESPPTNAVTVTLPEPVLVEGTAQILNVNSQEVDGILFGYIFYERHTFTDVSEPAEIVISQSGEVIQSGYTSEYAPDSRTLTIEFEGLLLPPGEQATSLVQVDFADGSSGESSATVRSAKLDSLVLTMSPSEEVASVDFNVSGTCTLPSVGELTDLQIEIWPYDEYDESFVRPLSSADLGETFQFTITESGMDFLSAPVSATAVISGYWSVGSMSTQLWISTSTVYPEISALSVTESLPETHPEEELINPTVSIDSADTDIPTS